MMFAAVLLIAVLLRLINISQSFWLDEAAQVIESARPLGEQFNIASDFHPPLFHLLLHFWMKVGNSEIWIRMLSVIFGICSIIILYKIGLSVGKKSQAIMASLLLAISPYHIWYSQEARPYMLFVFISLLSSYLLIREKWVLYTVTIILSLYTSYFAPFLIVGHLFYILFLKKKYLGYFLKSLILGALFFLPWVPSFVQQLLIGTGGFFSGWTNIVSVSPLRAIPLTFAKFIFGHGTMQDKLLYGVIILPIFFLFIDSIRRIWKDKEAKTIIVLFTFPFLSAIFFSFFIPVIAPQRLIFLLPLFYLILALGLIRYKGVEKIIGLILILGISIGGVYQYYTDPNTSREQWREAVAFTETEPNNQNVALFIFPDPFASYLWYKKDKIEAIGIAPKFIFRDEDLENLLPKLANKKRVFLFQYLTGLTDPKEKAKKFLMEKGFKESSIKDFPGVGFVYVFEK